VLCLALGITFWVLRLHGKGREQQSCSLSRCCSATAKIHNGAAISRPDEGMKEEEFADGMTEELIDKTQQDPRS